MDDSNDFLSIITERIVMFMKLAKQVSPNSTLAD